MIGVHMYNSTDSLSQGHGFFCKRCFSIVIANSTFENLSAAQGGAIFLEDMVESVSNIWNNTFYRNKANLDSGAMKLMNPSQVYLL